MSCASVNPFLCVGIFAQGLFPHIPPIEPMGNWDTSFGIPWWRDKQYQVRWGGHCFNVSGKKRDKQYQVRWGGHCFNVSGKIVAQGPPSAWHTCHSMVSECLVYYRGH